MAVTLVSAPTGWDSAYKPVRWQWTSTKAPNATAGEFAFITEIRNPTAGEIATYPTLTDTDVIAVHSALSGIALGDYVDIQGTDDTLYSGQYRVLSAISATITKLDAADVGDDTGGTITKIYRNYTLFATVAFEGAAATSYKFRLDRNVVGIFELDLQEAAKAQFADIFTFVPKTGGVVVSDADTALAVNYSISVHEGYDVPDSEGVATFTEYTTPKLFSRTNYKVVNSVHPYVHFDEQGDVDFQYTDGIDPAGVRGYVVRSTDTAIYNKWLTDAPVVPGLLGQTTDHGRIALASTDRYYLGFLCAQAEAGTTWYIGVSRYQSDGTLIGTTYVSTTAPLRAGVVGCGPAQLTAQGISLSSVAYYSVFLTNTAQNRITLPFSINIDDACDRDTRTWYWKNKWGAIDAFRLRGRIEQTNTVGRRTQYKPTIKLGGDDFNTRVYGADIQRGYAMTSQLLTPEELRWLGDDMAESIDVRELSGASGSETWRWVVITAADVPADLGYKSRRTRMPLEWTYGHDNRTHRG